MKKSKTTKAADKQYKKHEDMCERCGRCCQNKVEFAGRIVPMGHCPFYDLKKRECLCYENRFEVNPQCLTVLKAMMKKVMPEDCVYTRGFPGYRTKVNEWQTKGEKV